MIDVDLPLIDLHLFVSYVVFFVPIVSIAIVLQVPAVYKPTSAGRRKTKKVIEFDPSVPSVSSSEELKSEPGSVPRRPRTRYALSIAVFTSTDVLCLPFAI